MRWSTRSVSAFGAAGRTRQTDTMSYADLSFLPDEYRRQVIRTKGSGEVMWPRHIAAEVVQALAANGRVVLGLDLRSDGTGTRPSGLATEIPWSTVGGKPGDRIAPETATDAALTALERPALAEMVGYDWIVITWADA
jgi:hypothetical protein